MTRRLDICIDVPDSVSEETIRLAKEQAKEMVVVLLQQRGEFTIREAAMELGLTYGEYLQILADKGLPATSGDADPAVLDAFRRWLAQREPQAS